MYIINACSFKQAYYLCIDKSTILLYNILKHTILMSDDYECFK